MVIKTLVKNINTNRTFTIKSAFHSSYSSFDSFEKESGSSKWTSCIPGMTGSTKQGSEYNWILHTKSNAWWDINNKETSI